jgi:hypothetical protein
MTFKCDSCGEYIADRDLQNGAVLSIPDQPETDNLCIECNLEETQDVAS